VSRYVTYNPEQVWLLPPSVREELGEGHLAVFVHELVERLDLRQFEQESSEQGRPGYPPQLLLKVWLYAYALGVTSSRRIEQRVHEDLGFRLLAGHLKPDHWTLNEFRKRHPKALNDVFTQVVEAARSMGMGLLGRVAIDSTRVAANASADRSDNLEQLRHERARIRQRIRRRHRPSSGNNGSIRYRGRWNSCENPGNGAVRAAIRRAAICAGVAVSCWATRRKSRCRTTTWWWRNACTRRLPITARWRRWPKRSSANAASGPRP
jgi:transposase